MSAIENGQGVLRRVLEEARCELRCRLADLTVLSPQVDPYRLDTRSGHRDGAWLAKQLDRTIGSDRPIHLRGLHYAIVAVGDIRKPNGEIYRNSEDDWIWLVNTAGKAARWLEHISFDRIVDNRNSEPIIHRKARVVPEAWVSVGVDIDLPDIDDLAPHVKVTGFEGRQPFALSIFGEKTSLEDVLLPIAERYEADLYLPAGEISDSLLYRMARDGAADGRPLVVLVLADCDPAGYQMAVSIGRKFQAFHDGKFPELEFEIVPVALTVEQVRDLGLPSTPLKETEKRADRWRQAYGVEQTEIDALATLQPQLLEEIVVDAIAPYFDSSLARRAAEAHRIWREKAQRMLAQQTNKDLLASARASAKVLLAEFKAGFEAINAQLQMAFSEQPELPPIEIPAPEIDENRARQASLISSQSSWAEGTRALKSRKAYGEAK